MKLSKVLKPGVTLRVVYGDDNPNNTTIHVRGIVDGRVVYREWSRSRQRWRYAVESLYWFKIRCTGDLRTESGAIIVSDMDGVDAIEESS